jgi:predicted PilT family ATPase
MKTEIQNYLNQIATNYDVRYVGSNQTQAQLDAIANMSKNFAETLRFEEGKVYIKVCTDTSVHSFIVKEDTKQFRKGDILKAASWRSPAKNFARGNIFTSESYKNVCWAGA